MKHKQAARRAWRPASPQVVVVATVEDPCHRTKDALGRRTFRVAEAPGLTGDRENFARVGQRLVFRLAATRRGARPGALPFGSRLTGIGGVFQPGRSE
jgi:hypothetical protein